MPIFASVPKLPSVFPLFQFRIKRVAVMMICLAGHVSVTGSESESNAELWSFQPVSKVEVPLRDDPWVKQFFHRQPDVKKQ